MPRPCALHAPCGNGGVDAQFTIAQDMPRLYASHAPDCRAQVSLEYMLILAAFFSCLLLLMPVISTVYHTAVFAADAANARSFMRNLQNAVSQAENFAEGSSFAVESPVLTEWRLEARDGSFLLEARSAELGKSKTFSFPAAEGISFQENVYSKSIRLMAIRSETGVSIINNN